MEARTRIELVYTDLQSVASPLRHLAILWHRSAGLYRAGRGGGSSAQRPKGGNQARQAGSLEGRWVVVVAAAMLYIGLGVSQSVEAHMPTSESSAARRNMVESQLK